MAPYPFKVVTRRHHNGGHTWQNDYYRTETGARKLAVAVGSQGSTVALLQRRAGRSGSETIGRFHWAAIRLREWTDEVGTKILWRCSPPLAGHEHIVTSAIDVGPHHQETLIFPATPDGDWTADSQLPGSYVGGVDHDEAIKRAGYPPVGPTR